MRYSGAASADEARQLCDLAGVSAVGLGGIAKTAQLGHTAAIARTGQVQPLAVLTRTTR